jgi:aryl-alcohol dehydrogenase
MQIRAAISRKIGADMQLESCELEEPGANEVRVRLVATGICHTDMAMRDHKIYPIPHPAIFGHEGGGVVEKIGQAVSDLTVGDHVVLSFGHCGHCVSCHSRHPSYCDHFDDFNFRGSRGDGTTPLSQHGQPISLFQAQSSFATHAVCHRRQAVNVTKSVPLELLCPLGCAVQTGAGAIINSFKLQFGQSIAIFGTGSVGLCALMAAKMVGASQIIAIDRNSERLALAQALGATHTIDSREGPVQAALYRILPSGVDFTFETTANMSLLREATQVLARRGVCGFVGGIPAGTEVTLDVEHMMTGGRTFRGIILGDSEPQEFLPKMAKAIEAGLFPIDKIITRYPFEQINQAIADSENGRTIKAVLQFAAAA